ncbi:hypothetical protein [Streptomyces sp. NPDC050504]|uniref:hypothetical protein n=1 Tax=Streptomyces sp. NPDC050504 TaxID=3365618 RepID=UPI0037980D64
MQRWRESAKARAASRDPHPQHNLFEAASAYVVACIEDDEDRMEEATGWVDPNAMVFGINELACRAVISLARERNESPQKVARDLLGLPAV